MADLEQLVLSISADTRQMQRGLDRLTGETKKAADSVDAAFSKAPPSIDNVSKSLGKTKFETANLAAQLWDIAVQLQGGQSPFTIALQQGAQINQVLGQKVRVGLSACSARRSRRRLRLFVGHDRHYRAGGFAVPYAAKAIGAVGDLNDKLKTYGELIKSLKDAYGKGVDAAVHEAAAVLETLLGFKTDEIQREFKALTQSAVTSMSDFASLGDAAGQTIESTAKKFPVFKGPIYDLREGLKGGTPDVNAFRRTADDIKNSTSDENVKKLVAQLLNATARSSGACALLVGQCASGYLEFLLDIYHGA